MSKIVTQSDHAQSLVSNEAESAQRKEIIEVCPPKKTGSSGSGFSRGEREFFPLISAAHEFKTPLVVMMGYTDLLRSGHLGPVNDRQTQVLGEIQESAERLQKLIQNLLLLYELRAANAGSRTKVEADEAEVNADLEEIFDYWAPAAKQKSISYSFEGAPGNPRVRVEPLKLQHIVSNLIENALKFTPAAGEVVVSATT